MLRLTSALALLALPAAAQREVAPVPAELAERLKLDTTFYAQHLDCGGIPILASQKVDPRALLEAAYIMDAMLEGRDDIRSAIAASGIRLAIMAPSEMTTAVPEHRDLRPKKYWDRRARGLGATRRRPAVSCGEENLLQLRGDPYWQESILVHEFAHVIHQIGLKSASPDFEGKLRVAFEAAMKAGLWKDKYAASNRAEYWAEAVQSWFDTNRPPDHDHNHVDTRQELLDYDPKIAALVAEVFGDNDWRFKWPKDRKPEERKHLEGFDRDEAPRFKWPEGLNAWYREYMRKQREKR